MKIMSNFQDLQSTSGGGGGLLYNISASFMKVWRNFLFQNRDSYVLFCIRYENT